MYNTSKNGISGAPTPYISAPGGPPTPAPFVPHFAGLTKPTHLGFHSVESFPKDVNIRFARMSPPIGYLSVLRVQHRPK